MRDHLDAAVLLVGGGARRLGGADKALAMVGGRPLLVRVIEACRTAGAGAIVAVGPERFCTGAGGGNIFWCREQPPGAGPVAAAQAGLAQLSGRIRAGNRVALLAGDLPFLDARTLRDLAAAMGDGSGAVLLDQDGAPQWLAGVWDGAALGNALAAAARPAGGPGGQCRSGTPAVAKGRSLRSVLGSLGPAELALPGRHPPPWWDCDNQADLDTARRWAAVSTLEDWMGAVAEELAVPADWAGTPARDCVLDLARDVAHGVARPAAPITAFLLGVAAGAGRTGPGDIADLIGLADRVRALLPDQ